MKLTRVFTIAAFAICVYTVTAKPVAEFTSINNCGTVTFTDQSTDSTQTIVSWLWDFGDGATSMLQNPVHAYSNPGNYTVWLTVQNNLAIPGNIQHSVTIISLAPPVVSVTGGGTICIGDRDTLTASGGTFYTWFPATGLSNVVGAITLASPTTTTTYTVTASDVNGCTASASRTVTVNPSPTVSISNPASMCAGQSVTLTASGGGSYAWNTGANNASITVSPTATTTYTVTVINANGCTASRFTNGKCQS